MIGTEGMFYYYLLKYTSLREISVPAPGKKYRVPVYKGIKEGKGNQIT